MRSSNGSSYYKQPKTKTQQRAMRMLQREEEMSKMGRLESLLVQQYITKFGAKGNNSKINDMIKSTVKKYMNYHADIQSAERDLSDLERHLEDISLQMKIEISDSRRNSRQPSPQVESIPVAETKNKKSLDSLNEWPVINAILAAEKEEQDRRIANKKREEKIKYQRELRQQIEKNKSKGDIHVIEKREALEKNKEDYAKYQNDQQALLQRKEDKLKTERSQRLEQIELNKLKRAQEREFRIQQEKIEMERSRQRSEEEKLLNLKVKEKQKVAQDLLYIENEHNKKTKMAIKEREFAQDKKLNADYEAKMEREERARIQREKDRVEQLQKAAERQMKLKAVVSTEKGISNQGALTKILEMERIQKEKEDEKKMRLKLDLRHSVEFNNSMSQRKKEAKERERLEDIERRKQLEKDAEEARRKELLKKEAKKSAMLDIKKQLDTQVEYRNKTVKNKGPGLASLSELEISLNKSIIRKLENDENLAEAVISKVKRTCSPRRSSSSIF